VGLAGDDEMNIYVQNSNHRMCVEFWVQSKDENGKRVFAQNIEWEASPEGFAVPATGELTYGEAQELANALWSAGIRPEQSKQSQGAYDAQGQHLADMRAIAFDKLKVERP
jgi:hypothetical protein